MIRDEHERLVDRLASGHASPEEEAEIRTRANEDPRLARLLRAEQAIVVGLMADKATLPAGAVEPGAKLLAALNASTGGVASAVGGSLVAKGIIGGVVTIGLVAGLTLLPGSRETSQPTTAKPNVQERVATPTPPTAPVPVVTPKEHQARESATTLADPGTKTPKVVGRATLRSSDGRQSRTERSPARIKKEGAEGSSNDKAWSKATKRGMKSTNSAETKVEGK